MTLIFDISDLSLNNDQIEDLAKLIATDLFRLSITNLDALFQDKLKKVINRELAIVNYVCVDFDGSYFDFISRYNVRIHSIPAK